MAELTTMLHDLPDSTALVLVEDQLDPALIETWPPPGCAHIRGYDRPRPADLGRRIERRAKHHGGRIPAPARPATEPARA